MLHKRRAMCPCVYFTDMCVVHFHERRTFWFDRNTPSSVFLRPVNSSLTAVIFAADLLLLHPTKMLIYKDMLTNEELFSDSYPMKLVDDLYYRVTGKLTSESTDVDESVYGGNASAEGGGEEFESKLNEHYKKNLPDKVAEFQDKFQKLLKEVKKLLKAEEFQFFQTISASGEGMFALLGYEEDGMTPYMIFYKLGLQEEKQGWTKKQDEVSARSLPNSLLQIIYCIVSAVV
ncbi:translationally-controlled tumor protein [Apostichopus japonicus]|uniref:Translationally-controlled tumor protein n=1 Tax=Stichopus japonicus TaxID=307972 RepID=A0A2G8JQM6_STIJA|nr:translationally-controlled tumor protein [Apostichopus japonicus]